MARMISLFNHQTRLHPNYKKQMSPMLTIGPCWASLDPLIISPSDPRAGQSASSHILLSTAAVRIAQHSRNLLIDRFFPRR